MSERGKTFLLNLNVDRIVWQIKCPRNTAALPGRDMLRITIEEKGDAVVLRLEGQLIGPWVADVEQCWRSVFATLGQRTVQVDLSAVNFMDFEGGALLNRMHDAGFRLAGGDSLGSGVQGDGDRSGREN